MTRPKTMRFIHLAFGMVFPYGRNGRGPFDAIGNEYDLFLMKKSLYIEHQECVVNRDDGAQFIQTAVAPFQKIRVFTIAILLEVC